MVEIDRFLVATPLFLALTFQMAALAAAVACLCSIWTIFRDVASAVALVA